MRNTLAPLFPILILLLAGVLIPILYFRRAQHGDQNNRLVFDQAGSLLGVLLVVAILSMGLFIFILFFYRW